MTGPYPGFPVGGQFGTIVCDPPWPYRNGPKGTLRVTPYASMTEGEIFHLPVGDAAARDSVLLLWTTNAHIGLAVECLRHWGFVQKTMLTWVKTTRTGRPRPGIGFWLRGSTEHAILAVRGHPPTPRARSKGGEKMPTYTTAIMERPSRHSEKPRAVITMMEHIGPGPRLELFARRRRAGWTVWGNELATTVETTLQPTLAEVPA